MKTLLKNGTLIDYKTNIFEKYDILIEEDKITKIEKTINKFNNDAINPICTLENFSFIFDSFNSFYNISDKYSIILFFNKKKVGWLTYSKNSNSKSQR